MTLGVSEALRQFVGFGARLTGATSGTEGEMVKVEEGVGFVSSQG